MRELWRPFLLPKANTSFPGIREASPSSPKSQDYLHQEHIPNKTVFPTFTINITIRRRGLGALKSNGKIGSSEWKTAIWFDTKINT
jgi:hypothetical protein